MSRKPYRTVTGKPVTKRQFKTGLALAALALGTTTLAATTARVIHQPSLNTRATQIIGADYRLETLTAIAPIGVPFVTQTATSQPYSSTLLSLGFARTHVTDAADWTQSSANSNEYYYSGSSYAAGTEYLTRARFGPSGPKGRAGTLGSLDTYGYAYGDNDSIGSSTLYVRMGDSMAPADAEVHIVWDDTYTGESAHDGISTCVWEADTTHGGTVTGLAAWDSGYRYITDPRTGTTIDMAGKINAWNLQVCLPAGSYRWNCTITNSAGLTTVKQFTFTVNADTRTVKTVKASGGDYTTIEAAVNAASTDWKIEVEGGHTESTSNIIYLDGVDGVCIEWDGTGDMPVITSTNRMQVRGSGTTLYGLKFATSGASNEPTIRMFECDNLAVVNCDFGGDQTNYYKSGIQCNSSAETQEYEGLLVQNCSITYVDSYVIGAASISNSPPFREFLIIGNDFDTGGVGPSHGESTIRDASYFNVWSIVYNALSENNKDALRFTNLDHGIAFGNKFTNGVFRIGQSGSAHHKTMNLRVDSNLFIRTEATSGLGCVNLDSGINGCFGANNIFVLESESRRSIAGTSYPGSDTTYYLGYREHNDILFVNSTVWVKSGFGNTEAALLGSGVTNDTYVTNCSFTANHIVKVSSYTQTAIANEGFTSVGNTVEVGELDSNYRPTVEAASYARQAGAFLDYFGNTRESTTFIGAAQIAAADTGGNSGVRSFGGDVRRLRVR